MPEIPYAYHHVTQSDTHTNTDTGTGTGTGTGINTNQNLHQNIHQNQNPNQSQSQNQTAAAAISPLRSYDYGHHVSASNDAAHHSLDYDPTTDYAYPSNPNSDTVFCNSLYPESSANNTRTHDAVTTANNLNAGTPYRSHSTSSAAATNAAILPNLSLASFGSQPWPATSAPYLDFAPQPLYEPTGELVHESAHHLHHFNDPSSFGQPTWTTEEEAIAPNPQHQSTPNARTPQTTLSSPTLHKDAQSFPKPALKRPLESDPGSDLHLKGSQHPRPPLSDPRKIRRVSFERMSGTGPASADDEDSSSSDAPSSTRATPGSAFRGLPRRGRGSRGASKPPPPRPGLSQPAATRPPNPNPIARGSKTPTGHPPSILPPEKVFPIQIGSELFRLSGASISSDAPSYFTQFFEEQIRQNEESGGVRTLYIDRDPETFRDVARHLQGYFVKPRDGSHFVKLFADAQFYSLPRLIDQLFEAEIFIQIGERHFQIPKDIFSDPGNSPNFFSLGFAVFFSTPGEVFPGLDRRGLLRPPSITPPYVSGRSADTFAQLLHLLRGYPLHIQNEDHRAELLRDCRYFHLRGLEQKIIAHEISYNLERQKTEICVRIEDIKPSGISYKADEAENEQDVNGGWVRYARPFVDDTPYELVVEIGGESMSLDLNDMRADFHGLAKARVSSLFQVVANKMNLPTNAPLGLMLISGAGQSTQSASPGHTPLSEDRVKVRFDPSSDIWLDGARYEIEWTSSLGQCMSRGPNKPADSSGESDDAMSEDNLVERQSAPQRTRSRQSQQVQSRPQSSRAGSSTHAHGGVNAPPPRLDTSGNTSRKRRRPTVSAASTNSGHGEWVIRSAQWRLRVQHNDADAIRGGHEIVFMAVKVDAFSQERARNARRKFLGGG